MENSNPPDRKARANQAVKYTVGFTTAPARALFVTLTLESPTGALEETTFVLSLDGTRAFIHALEDGLRREEADRSAS
jgi:hypothetical protein